MKKYLIKDIRLGASEQDQKQYTLEELKEYFKVDLTKCNEEDVEEFRTFNIALDVCEDIDTIEGVLYQFWNDFYSFEEVK